MKINITQEQLKVVGQAGVKIGKQIVVEGTKAVLFKGAFTAVETTFEKGIGGVKQITLDKFLGIDEESKAKKGKLLKKLKNKMKKKDGEVEIVEIEDGLPEDE